MAILKHVSIRNTDYGAAQRYLLFEHDPETGKPVYDENGDMMLRKGYIQSAMNCDPFTFNTECTELNQCWQKNRGKHDVMAHHYILSFAPPDVTEHGLTPEKAHALAEEFAQRFFAGHQVLMVTHVDGHNHSGNLHTHIVLNSLRKENVPLNDFMERPIDAMAGYKHHQTRDLLRTMQLAVNDMCAREHLSTVDYSLPAERRITDREYQAIHAGQGQLDKENQEIIDAGLSPRQMKFETIKQRLREAIDRIVEEAKSEEEFIRIMRENCSIEIRIRRGCWSFTCPDREKPIRDRSLGRIYTRANAMQRMNGITDISENISREYAALPKIFLTHSDLHLVTDLQTCIKAQQSRAYARKITISNLQQMAKSVAYLQEHCIDTMENLQKLREDAEAQYKAASTDVRETQIRLTAVNTQLHYMGQYLSGKKLYAEFLGSDDKPAFRATHRQEIDEYEAAAAYLKAVPDGKGFIPIDQLRMEHNALQKELTHKKSALWPLANQRRTLGIIAENVQALLHPQAVIETYNSKPRAEKDLF